MNPIQITPGLLIDLTDELAGFHVINLSIGSDHQAYLSLTTQKEIGDYPRKYHLLQTNGSYSSSFKMPVTRPVFARPLEATKWLFVHSTSRTSRDDNAFILNDNWKIQQSFFAGSDILDVQVTSNHQIWVRYGYFGYLDNPELMNEKCCFIACQFTDKGNQYDVFYPPDGGSECYSMNITSNNEIWMLIDKFEGWYLAHIVDNKAKDYWQAEIIASPAFAIWYNYVMFCGSYENRLIFSLYRLLDNHEMTHVADYQFFSEPVYTTTRGSLIICLQNTKLYQIDLKDIIANL